MPNATVTAIALRRKKDGRFFSGFSKTGRLQTAWCLAGAKLFGVWQDSLIFKVELEFCKRGHVPQRVVVRLGDQ